MYIKNGTRLIQTIENKNNRTFTMYNNRLENTLTINYTAAKVVRAIGNNKYVSDDNNEFLEELYNYGYINKEKSDDYVSKCYFGNRFQYKFPLTNINLELTDACNLNCIHCYGKFPKKNKKYYIPYEWLESSIRDFDELHVKSFSLTGGESTLHPRFIDIALLLLKNGYELCVFTNGNNPEIIKELLKKTTEYNYMIKVSLDSFEHIHNEIRGNDNSYSKVIQCLDYLKEYDNINVYISTVIMKNNLEFAGDFKTFIATQYPNFNNSTDLVYPAGNADECSFRAEELYNIMNKAPFIFKNKNEGIDEGKHNRCSGGVSQCTIMPNGYMKICNSACDEEFLFKHNAFKEGIIKSWIDCGKNIKIIRKEKKHKSNNCKKCNNIHKCHITDCRVLAKSYTGSSVNSNPVACMIVKGE